MRRWLLARRTANASYVGLLCLAVKTTCRIGGLVGLALVVASVSFSMYPVVAGADAGDRP